MNNFNRMCDFSVTPREHQYVSLNLTLFESFCPADGAVMTV